MYGRIIYLLRRRSDMLIEMSVIAQHGSQGDHASASHSSAPQPQASHVQAVSNATKLTIFVIGTNI